MTRGEGMALSCSLGEADERSAVQEVEEGPESLDWH